MQIHLTIACYSLNYPQNVDLVVPQQDIWHGVSKRERHASRGQSQTLSVGYSIAVPVVNIDYLVV